MRERDDFELGQYEPNRKPPACDLCGERSIKNEQTDLGDVLCPDCAEMIAEEPGSLFDRAG